MKKSKTISLFSLVFAVTFFSCEKILNLEQKTGQITEDGFFKTTADFDSYMLGAYSEMAGQWNNTGTCMWIITQANVSQDLLSGDQNPEILSNYMSPTNGAFTAYWTDFYKIATKANLILSRLPNASLPAADKTRLEGEAKFLRGFGYFFLARAYGSIPLLTTEFEISQIKAQCTPEAQVWDAVITDFTDAAQKLPGRNGWSSDNTGRATKGAALGFLANAYMYKKDWLKAESTTNELFALNEYNLLPDVRRVFAESNPNHEESLFEVQYKVVADANAWSGQNELGSVLGVWTPPAGIGAAYAPSGGWGGAPLNRKVADSYDPNDDRRKKLVKVPGEKYKGESMADTCLIPLNIQQNRAAFSTKFWLGPGTIGQSWLTGQNVPILRLAEAKLNMAEILFELNKVSLAYRQLNDVRARALLPARAESSDRETFFANLMNERRWELTLEPNLWFHYTRTGRAMSFLQTVHGIANPNTAWNKFPIPQSERDQNPNLCQNPGY